MISRVNRTGFQEPRNRSDVYLKFLTNHLWFQWMVEQVIKSCTYIMFLFACIDWRINILQCFSLGTCPEGSLNLCHSLYFYLLAEVSNDIGSGPLVKMYILTPSSSSMISFPIEASVVHLQLLIALTAHLLWALNLQTVNETEVHVWAQNSSCLKFPYLN